jgi:hypothetical protein
MTGTVAIAGAPFTGTTLLAFLLGEHPEVANIGEYMCRYCYDFLTSGHEHPYFSSDPLGVRATFCDSRINCRLCGKDCHTWAMVPHDQEPQNIYSRLCNQLDVKWVVDSSKVGRWFQEALATEDTMHEALVVVVHKPVWGHVASQARYRKINANNASDDFIEKHAGYWRNWHINIRELAVNHRTQIISYESIAGHPWEMARTIWGMMGLQTTTDLPSMRVSAWLKQHPIDGSYKLCNKLLYEWEKCSRVPITMDPAVNAVDQSTRDRMMAVDGVAETMEWLGR